MSKSQTKSELQKIRNRDQLLESIGITKKHLSYILYVKKIENSYTKFTIPKKSGGERTIYTPVPKLKIIQKKIAKLLADHHDFIRKGTYNNISHGFEKGKSIITNADVHRNKRIVINIDLENFFETIHFGRVKGYFQKNNNLLFSEKLATQFAQIVCYKGFLPQGSPCSPIVSNLICSILDRRLLLISKKYKLNYTRYADDLTFSTNDINFHEKEEKFNEHILKEINKAGFTINDKKNRVQFKDSRQTVTGLTVNKRINVSREFYKDTRAMAYQLYKNKSFKINNKEANINQLEGRFNFIYQVDQYNRIKTKDFFDLKNSEKDYQRFLFYKYFYSNSKPIILTEGKTDPIYIKAALKNLYQEYPDLIKEEDNEFTYSFMFLRRLEEDNKKSKINYFFEITADGGHSLFKIYNFYKGLNKPNYYEELYSIGKSYPTNPVIILLDNEPDDGKPLNSFLNLINGTLPGSKKTRRRKFEELKKKLTEDFYCHIGFNLYLLVTPKGTDTPKSDIEDLFDQDTLGLKIDGRSFNKSNTPSPNTYDKIEFAKEVNNNYSTINFSNFKGMLNNIDTIIKNYKSTNN